MAIQSKKIKELKDKWGNKVCSHPNFTKEYDWGAQTGDYVCMQCGEIFTKEQKIKIEQERIQENSLKKEID